MRSSKSVSMELFSKILYTLTREQDKRVDSQVTVLPCSLSLLRISWPMCIGTLWGKPDAGFHNGRWGGEKKGEEGCGSAAHNKKGVGNLHLLIPTFSALALPSTKE